MRLGLGLGLDIGYRSELFGGTSYLLDTYTGAAAAYSLRQLRTDVTNVVRVRRSSDNEELDITAAEVSDGTLTTWVGANNGFVVTWYDQSGNGNDAAQATAANQPKIVDAGSLITENGKPCLSFDGSNTNLANTSFSLDETIDLSGIIVTKTNDTTIDQFIIASVNASSNRHAIGVYNTGVFSYQKRLSTQLVVSGIADTMQNLLFTINSPSIYINSVLGASGTTTLFNARSTDNVFFIGGNSSGSANRFNGSIQEVVYWQSDQSANRTDIEAEINTHYSIY